MALQLLWIGRSTAFCKPIGLPDGFKVEVLCVAKINKEKSTKYTQRITNMNL
jgi:hypothetical protein